MTRKDYELIAKAISKATRIEKDEDATGKVVSYLYTDWTGLVADLGEALKKDNPRFNEYIFFDACEPQE